MDRNVYKTFTLATATARLEDYLDAELKILAGQEKTIGGRTLKRADLDKHKNFKTNIDGTMEFEDFLVLRSIIMRQANR